MFKKPIQKLVFLFLILLLQNTANAQELLLNNQLDEIIKIARNYGSATLTTQNNGNPKIIGKINHIPYTIRFLNCPRVKSCEDMNFSVGFQIKPDINIINDWNKSKRFSKAYLDDEKDVILEWDVIIAGGISIENMDKSFSYWRLTLGQFIDHIDFK